MSSTANPLLHQEINFNGKSTANTKAKRHRTPRLEQKLVQNSKFQRSGKRNPCPICDRTKDDKCAWNSSLIYCYNGNSNYPPQDLDIGHTFEIEIGSITDGKWALVNKNKGFSGIHWMFIPDKPIDKTKPLIKRNIKKVSIPKLNKLFNILSELVTEALRLDPMLLTLKQLEEVSKKTDEALERTKVVLGLSKQFSQKELINDIQLANLFETTKTYLHKLNNRIEQIKQFKEVCLGEETNGHF